MKIRFHHVGILVKNISEAIDKYSAMLGIGKEKITVQMGSYRTAGGEEEEFKFSFLPLAEGEDNFIELVEPTTPGPTARYLNKHGEGLFHLAFESPDILETIKEIEKAGCKIAGSTPTEEVISVFFHPRDSHGVLIQVVKEGIFTGQEGWKARLKILKII